MKNGDSVVVVESRGFSDKKIKIESLKNVDGVTITGQVLSDYIDNLTIKDLTTELDRESKQQIGYNRKPVLRYRSQKEAPGVGVILSRSQINREFNERIMKHLNDIKAPVSRYVIAALLSGETFTYDKMAAYIKEKSGKIIKPGVLNGSIVSMMHSKVSFLLNKVGKMPATWHLEKRALEMTEEDIYKLTLKSNEFTLEKACMKYPFLIDILNSKENVKIDLNDNAQEDEKQASVDVEKQEVAPAIVQDMRANIIDAVSTAASKGKFDLNVNINFRIFFG